MNGKSKCKILKEIRTRIAAANDIPYVTSQCRHQGECRGTCPKCEQELRYLEQQLDRRKQLGKVVTVSALALSLTAGAVGCVPLTDETEVTSVPSFSQNDAPVKGALAEESALSEEFLTPTGELCESQRETEVLMGEPTETALTGDLVVGELPEANE